MAEYIERGKVMDMLHAEMDAWGNCADEIDALLKANEKLFEIPPDDVAPVRHGRWIETGRGLLGAASYKCSECEQPMPFYNGYKYCPNCGAKMDGGETDA